ncbi:unnamed protein product [Linum tenue]|uniref:Dirigent protein n=1 Tax=Linum tenue TaxID=586396 RepID=A0AAV0PC82_9ROSI|nr:unnamed protein product [Linum tenue]
MARLFLAILIISMAATTPPAQAQAPTNWAKRLNPGPDTVTNLQFYFHDIPSGTNPTAVEVVQPVATASDSNPFFGSVVLVDDPLTETADVGSKLVGRAQGMYTASSRNEAAIFMSMSFGFVDGPYDGSSLSVMGNNLYGNPTREVPVSGGTGIFRMARGYAVLRSVAVNSTSGYVVVNYNVTVYTPAAAGAY